MCLCMCLLVCSPCRCSAQRPEKGIGSPGTGIINICEPDVGPGNQTWVLYKHSSVLLVVSLAFNSRAICPVPVSYLSI